MANPKIHRLVLYPRDAQYAAAWQPIMQALQAAEFIANRWGGEAGQRFTAGNRFLAYITFMGCSPYIEFEPPPDGSSDFCHVQFSEIYSGTQFRRASQNVFARCPKCGKRLANWESAVLNWREDPARYHFQCDKCHGEVSLYQLGWRHNAGFSRMFIDVMSIYPQEGVPVDALLALLEKASGTPWDYFYTDQ